MAILLVACVLGVRMLAGLFPSSSTFRFSLCYGIGFGPPYAVRGPVRPADTLTPPAPPQLPCAHRNHGAAHTAPEPVRPADARGGIPWARSSTTPPPWS